VRAADLLRGWFAKGNSSNGADTALRAGPLGHPSGQASGPLPGDLDAAACRDVLANLIRVAERFPRDYDHMHCALLEVLHGQARNDELRSFAQTWTELLRDVLTTPQWLELLFPDQTRADPALGDQTRALRNRRYLTASAGAKSNGQPLPDSLRPSLSNPLFAELLETLATADPAKGPAFLLLSRFYFFRDLMYGYFVDPGLKAIQRVIFHQCYLQRRVWPHSYAADYPYQGMERLGISGIKPSEERLERYDIAKYIGDRDRVLDIGSNNGLWALTLAPKVGHVDGLEYNPYLVAVGNLAKEHLGIANASFITADFVDFDPSHVYDTVFSLANHCTIDGNLSMDFEQYVAKVFSLLKPGGFLLFETHNVFGPGAGGPGDDGDLDAKFDIAERYFEVLRHKMTRAYVPATDIDKLFVVMRRRDRYEPAAIRTLHLSEARERYAY
jgi:SAM-dependent methyltransferase